jgi:hypothetical protein
MAGLSRSEYLATVNKPKSNKLAIAFKIMALAIILVFLPQFLLFFMGFWIVTTLLLGAVKYGIDLPDYR